MHDPSHLADEATALVATWVTSAKATETDEDRASTGPLQDLIEDPTGVSFTMRFIDRVTRPDDNRASATQLRSLIQNEPLPEFLSPIDRLLLKVGAMVGPVLPGIVIPLARRRMRHLVGHLIVDSESSKLVEHLDLRRGQGFAQNVNLLGEAVLGNREARNRFDAILALIADRSVDYVSVKLSSIVAQLNHWDWKGSQSRIREALSELLDVASSTTPPTFVNFDMEEYLDLDLTVSAFKDALDARPAIEAGIVLQAYLPDSFSALQDLVVWATQRHENGGSTIKIRLVKGANLAMEKVEAAIHGWGQAPYLTKNEVDANYKRCLDWALTPERTRAVKIGIASHNLFDVAWADLLAEQRGVANRIQFEMLQGMSPAQARVVRDGAPDHGLILYTPIVARENFDVAISYLFRRLEENAAPQNFMRSVFSLAPGTPEFERRRQEFVTSLASRWEIGSEPQRRQTRPALAATATAAGTFVNEPDTDPALPQNRAWAIAILQTPVQEPHAPLTTEIAGIDAALDRARRAQADWQATSPHRRKELLYAAASALARKRGDLIAAMVHEGKKTIAQADPEVSEAIDFAAYYADRAVELSHAGTRFEPLGTVAVVPPWNFPVAIPAGGVLAALAAGNCVILKPAPETPRCAEIVAECLWEAGFSQDVLQYIRTPDDEVGQRLIVGVDAVILTGSSETAAMFKNWNPQLRLFAETSGKNALIITPHADIDLAVTHLVASAFGHAGQKCSAASLAICVGDVYDSPRFRRQLIDAVESLVVGPATDISSTVGPLIGPPPPKLQRGLETLDTGEKWLVQPRQLDDSLWSPGVRIGVKPGSWFQQTECFGPVLGVMAARNLTEAIHIQNGNEFGLTGGIHTLDPHEIDEWIDLVQVGNAYVNRQITGAIVQRQPFGGWKRSSVGPGAKAGGPNYVAQLGTWHPETPFDADQLTAGRAADRQAWLEEFAVEHDPTGLYCEANIFRYRPLARIGLRVGSGASQYEIDRVTHAAGVAGCKIVISKDETDEAFAARILTLGMDRIRLLGSTTDLVRRAAAQAGVHIADDPVTSSGFLELRHYVREQAISRTLHRFGNIVTG